MMNRKEIELFTNLLRIGASIQTLYIKLHNMEINDEKETETYSKTFEILEDAIEIEKMEYFKNRKETKTINNLIHFINNPVITLETPKSLYDKTMPLARIYFRLLELTYDVDYQRSCYSKEDIAKINQYTDFETLFDHEIEEEYQPFLMQKELISGMINKFSKMVNKSPFKTDNVIEQKYLYSYIYSYIELVHISNKFEDDYDYPLMLREADYLRIDRESYNNNKMQLLAQESGRVMNNLLYENQDKIPFLMDKAYFQFITDSLPLEDLTSLENLYIIQKKHPLNGHKHNRVKLDMIKRIINKAINKKLDEYDLEKYTKKL